MVLVFVPETHMFFYSVSNLCTQTSFQACVLFLKLTFEHLVYSLNPHSVFFHFMLVEHSDLLPNWRVAFVLVVDGQSVRFPLACHTDISRRTYEFIDLMKLGKVYGFVETSDVQIGRVD